MTLNLSKPTWVTAIFYNFQLIIIRCLVWWCFLHNSGKMKSKFKSWIPCQLEIISKIAQNTNRMLSNSYYVLWKGLPVSCTSVWVTQEPFYIVFKVFLSKIFYNAVKVICNLINIFKTPCRIILESNFIKKILKRCNTSKGLKRIPLIFLFKLYSFFCMSNTKNSL